MAAETVPKKQAISMRRGEADMAVVALDPRRSVFHRRDDGRRRASFSGLVHLPGIRLFAVR
jgi:hypothetical protein